MRQAVRSGAPGPASSLSLSVWTSTQTESPLPNDASTGSPNFNYQRSASRRGCTLVVRSRDVALGGNPR